jgi:hypothetical protein
MGDGKEYYFAVYRPGPISVTATWAGAATDLNLALEGPGKDGGWNTFGTSPLRLGHLVTLEDLAKGYTWKISVIKHAEGGNAQGTVDLSYPKGCCFAGTWDTNFGKMTLKLLGDGLTIKGYYDKDRGIIDGTIEVAKIEGNKLVGEWKESPTYKAPKDAGDVELYMSADCKSLKGYWRNGYSGDWDGDWTGTRVDGDLALRPKGGWG